MAVEPLGRLILYIGVVMVLIGGFFILVAKVPWFGRLPGDFTLNRNGILIYVPITTMVLVSLVLTILMNIVWKR
ncbi:hypothetical protein A2291_03520 [candidate division WOR-1 bacterium RIFOXYB2_FULL_42_35]|uniref:DUF2905 domain-containing protein n=1 Tax=candidate division WOR-1 bacterium RIFOXYC2_FULL_41_25 TaxID=1802586 RepID=A0A1F4TQG8_UNCSA|nr:MAG: hypothetical protein A2247_03090 [candidate division WOR-1 bacterium RIFOXYA2_FULL_41_14]OGC25533.1 MAG: hypothetical protein A2291_03520 [candidate division WOR-1 bacterium RIFOXYB2_FULL_42_35]OGC34965.1 MAG: hypothetical protein A2462_05150 [candidate division WOR-1 bacterium RIFOXYC2_FULL_41_25]OGC41522.1 MAG: hypothetical protein A2548_01435 [candidate division WOR-1 bacterium RIFOXYD2_FULL_41_8]